VALVAFGVIVDVPALNVRFVDVVKFITVEPVKVTADAFNEIVQTLELLDRICPQLNA